MSDRPRLSHGYRFSPEAITRSAVARNAALCAGIGPFVAAMMGVKATKPQPHVWWPVGRRGQLCLRCSAYERDPR